MDRNEIRHSIEAILFASGEPVSADRMAFAVGVSEVTIHQEAKALQDEYSFLRRGIRVLRLDNAYQMVSDPSQADVITQALETRKPPRLSTSALEVLTLIAYYQPTTKAFIEQIRGVDSSYTISSLLNKKLIEERGHLAVPGRPILYGTTLDFLRTFGMTSLEELPETELPDARVTPEQLEIQIEDDVFPCADIDRGDAL